MYFFTHLFIARILYKNFKDETALNKWAFAFGNVKPDLPPDCFRERHTLDKTLFTVYDRAVQLSDLSLSKKEFSIKMGEVCHFICDFFCHYHLNETLHKRILPHLIYELLLHAKIYVLRFTRKSALLPFDHPPAENITSIIFELRREYLRSRRDMKKDIRYAITASTSVFQSIIRFSGCRQNTTPAFDDSAVFAAKGGSYEGSVIC